MGTPFPFPAIAAQAIATLAAFATMALWPPSSGRLLIVPLGNRQADAVVPAAIAAGAMLLGTGPLPGSQVVVGDRAALLAQITPWTTIVTAAPAAGCGSDVVAGDSR